MSPHRYAISIAIVAVIAVLAAPASAERRKRDRAERNEAKDAPTLTAADEAPRLLRRGVDHYREGRYAEAVEAFRQSHALSPSAKVRVNLALALWKKGDAVAAAHELDRTLAGRDVAPAVVERARSLLADIGKELGRVEIEVRGTGPVWLDERRIGTAPLSDRVWVTPGVHEVRTATQRERVTAAAGEVTSARLDAVTLQAGAVGSASRASSDDRTAAPARRRSRLWLVPAAATSVALGAGLGFALAARGDEQKLEDLNRASASHEYSEAASIKDRAEGRALFANISFAVAAVGAVAATWMLLDDSHSEGVELGFGGNYAYARGAF